MSTSKLDHSNGSHVLDERASTTGLGTVPDIESVRFPHLDFDFLQPDLIRDADNRLCSHPDYCPRTLYVPDAFMKKQTPGMTLCSQEYIKFEVANYADLME